MAKGSTASKTAVWILLGLLIVGLAGFGATNLSGTIRTIGSAGDKLISVDDYARQLQQEIRAIERQRGQAMSFAEAQQLGIDRGVLQQLVATRALDNEAAQLGLSIGDEELGARIVEIPAFQGLDGSFDREGYRFALEQAGLNEAEFETQMREEAARGIVQSAIASGIVPSETYIETLLAFVGEQRSFTWTLLDEAALDAPIPDADEATLRAHYDANIDDFTLPETKEITYAVLTPDDLLDSVEVDEAALRAAYDERADEFDQPERRLVERLAFLDTAAAEAAMATLADGGTFETLVEERGLTLSDVDLGDVTEAELDAAGSGVFAAEVGEVVGPLPSSLGPALFRVNAVLAAQKTSFEDAQDILLPQLASDRAVRLVEAQAESFDDLLAGGATLEDLAAETDMRLGSIAWDAASFDDIAAYQAFREAAASVTVEDFPEIDLLDDGGLFALRLDAVLPPRPAPFEDVIDAVRDHWQRDQVTQRLATQAETLVTALEGGQSFAELDLDAFVEENMLRSDFVPRTPPGFVSAVFEMAEGDARVIESVAAVILVQLDTVAPPADTPEMNGLRQQLEQQLNAGMAQDVLESYINDVLRRTNPQINQQAIDAVHVNFP